MTFKKQDASHRGARSLKLISSARGLGAFRTADAEVAVRYQMDTYEEKYRRTVSGSLEGDVSSVADRTPGRLRLSSGEEIEIVLIKPDQDGADFQAA